MSVIERNAPQLGEGLYSFPEAARILQRSVERVTTRQVRHWMNSGLVPSTFVVDGRPVLSFDDLVSLEIVRRFRQQNTSLQRIRQIEIELREVFGQERPFAWRTFFTDGAIVWGRHESDDSAIGDQLTGRGRGARVWMDAIETFAHEITYGRDQRAEVWHATTYVQLDPKIQFGAPVVRGTRITVDTIEANLRVADPEKVAEWYGLQSDEVWGVKEYLTTR